MADLEKAADLFQLFADPTRVRLVALVAQQELSVADLTSITSLPQSRVSTHLGKLREAQVLRDRKVGASTLYALNDGAMPSEARKVWSMLAEELEDRILDQDRARCDALTRARVNGRTWPEAFAGAMERHYSPGRTWESLARGICELLQLGDVLDVGAGDGALAEMLGPHARSMTCLDLSPKMMEAARTRLEPHRFAKVASGALAARSDLRLRLRSVEPRALPGTDDLPPKAFDVSGAGRTCPVRCVVGDAHDLPFADQTFDQVLMFHVLTHTKNPCRVVQEGARVLRSSGTLAIVTLDAHEHLDVVAGFHHLHSGFSPHALEAFLSDAALTMERCEVTSREQRQPYFEVITASARKS